MKNKGIENTVQQFCKILKAMLKYLDPYQSDG